MLVETLRADWSARGANARVCALPEFADGALTLGAGTKIADARGNRRDAAAEEERAIALVSVATGRPLDPSASTHVRRALAKAHDGDGPLALTHLALAGLGRLEDPREDARRLFIADGLMQAGTRTSAIIAALGGGLSEGEFERAYDPDQPRVPPGNGRPSGRWTSGDNGASVAPNNQVVPPKEPTDHASQGVQIADSSSDWAQFVLPIGAAEAAEARPPFNGLGPNLQHDQGVEIGKQALRAAGYEIVSEGPYQVFVPGFPTPRVYDFMARTPDGELVGVEVKTTKFSTIFFNPFQVEKDVMIGKLGGIELPALGGSLKNVVYQTMCDGCEALNLRTAYLLWRLQNAGVAFQYFHSIWGAAK